MHIVVLPIRWKGIDIKIAIAIYHLCNIITSIFSQF